MRPHITVVIATTGERREMLAEAVRSVYAQDYTGPVDLLIVLDSDQPEPRLPAPPAAFARPRIVRNTGRPGLAGARNFGLTHVTGEWMATLDDDDLWQPDKLSRQMQLAETAAAAVLIGCGIWIQTPGAPPVPRYGRAARLGHADLIRDRIIELHHSTFLVRTSQVRAIGGWDEGLAGSYAEDYDFLLRLAEHGDFALVPDPLVSVRWSGNSYFFSRWADIATALRQMLARHDFAADRRGYARVLGQIAFAEAAGGQRGSGARDGFVALGRNPAEVRGFLALLVSAGLVRADTIQRFLHSRGRGI
jgi:GT2 family glycosyltransferase